jgi:hypothetical protein
LVSGGQFSVRQQVERALVTKLRLKGGDRRKVCARSSTGRAAATNEPVRRLLTRVDKRKKRKKRAKRITVEVSGNYSSGSADQTAWLTEDRCNGTFTRVESGTVRVRDLVRHTTVTVRAGQSYLALAP